VERPEWRDHLLADLKQHRVIEHYRFYTSTQKASHRWYLMSFLARSSLIDEEILDDPEMDTCEDLCLMLQFAQKTHFAFSGEVTAVHWYQTTSSTRVDASQHIPNTRRISDRNHGRYFPADIKYLNQYSRMIDPNYPQGYPRGMAYGWEVRVMDGIGWQPVDPSMTGGVLVPPTAPAAPAAPGPSPEVPWAGMPTIVRRVRGLSGALKHYISAPKIERRRLHSRFREFVGAHGWRGAVARIVQFGHFKS
jgi:hypothetical protein